MKKDVPIVHDRFVIERTYRASPERVFEAWSDPAVKARWFVGPEEWKELRRTLDFRVGGEELLHGRLPTRDTLFKARYHLIEPNRRIVYVYDMWVGNDVHHSLSLATVELCPAGASTTLVFTEQVAFFDGTASAESRMHGTAIHLDRIPAHLQMTAP